MVVQVDGFTYGSTAWRTPSLTSVETLHTYVRCLNSTVSNYRHKSAVRAVGV